MEHKKGNPKIIKRIEIITVLISLIIIATLVYGLASLGLIETTVKGTIYNYGIPTIIISSMILDLIPQFVSPFIVLATAIIVGINIHLAIMLTILGSTVGAIIGFILGKKYMFTAVYYFVSQKKVEKMTKMMNNHGKWAVPLMAVSPLPYLPVLIGALNFSKKNFIIYGLIPRAIGLTIFGYLINLI